MPLPRSPLRAAPLLAPAFFLLLQLLLSAPSVSSFSVPVPGMSGPGSRNVAVIGGGPVGIEAAVHLVDEGFRVTVCSAP